MGYSHRLSKTPALPSLVPGHGLPPNLPGYSLQGGGGVGGANWGDFSRWGGDGEKEVGEGELHSYSSQACLVRRSHLMSFFLAVSDAQVQLKNI